jgi:hypothetical protein
MYSDIMPDSATPGRMIELATTTSSKLRQRNRSNNALIPGLSI